VMTALLHWPIMGSPTVRLPLIPTSFASLPICAAFAKGNRWDAVGFLVSGGGPIYPVLSKTMPDVTALAL
jgi:hypothetical protein